MDYWGGPPDPGAPPISDLNRTHLTGDGWPATGQRLPTGGPLVDPSTRAGDVAVYFRDLESHLVALTQKHTMVVGCVAWLTSHALLDAFADLEGVSLVVQKEDWLRPEGPCFTKQKLVDAYDALPATLDRWNLGSPLNECSTQGHRALTDGAVRVVGNCNSSKNMVHPRMHNKFLVFGDDGSEKVCPTCYRGESEPSRVGTTPWWSSVVKEHDCAFEVREVCFEPKAVWSGSFNLTNTAGMSFENAVVLTDPKLVAAYYQEFCSIAALSEPLDWNHVWMTPQWRVGS